MKAVGAQAVFGRALTADEIRVIMLIDDLEAAYFSRESAANKYTWAKENDYKHRLLSWARRQAIELNYDEE